jgi:hypothetical protein
MMIPYSGRDQTVLTISRRGGREGDFAILGLIAASLCVPQKELWSCPANLDKRVRSESSAATN